MDLRDKVLRRRSRTPARQGYRIGREVQPSPLEDGGPLSSGQHTSYECASRTRSGPSQSTHRSAVSTSSSRSTALLPSQGAGRPGRAFGKRRIEASLGGGDIDFVDFSGVLQPAASVPSTFLQRPSGFPVPLASASHLPHNGFSHLPLDGIIDDGHSHLPLDTASHLPHGSGTDVGHSHLPLSSSASSRASAADARATASSPALLKKAVEQLSSRMFADGSEDVKASKLKLAEELARRAGCDPIYPLSEDLITKVGASLMAGRYLSASSYLGELRLQHQERDHPIGPALARRFQKVDAALARGQGPPRRAPEIKPSELNFTAADSDGGPLVGSTRSLITATAWLLREAEVADLDASARNVELHADGSVTLRLPMSKQDQRGVGAARRLGCLCSLERFDEAPPLAACGACAVRLQLDQLSTSFGASLSGRLDPRQLPRSVLRCA